MIKTWLKTLWRMFEKHLTRFLSIIFIVLISVGFISGIGSSTDKIKLSLTDYYKAQNVSDFIIKSKKEDGFSESDVQKIKDIYGEESVAAYAALDAVLDIDGQKQLTRLYFMDLDAIKINVPETVQKAEAGGIAAYFDSADNKLKGYETGAEITLEFKEILREVAEYNGKQLDAATLALLGNLSPVTVEIAGEWKSPLTFANDGEPSTRNPEDMEVPEDISGLENLSTLDNILYLPKEIIPWLKDALPIVPEERNKPFIATGDIAVAVSDRSIFKCFDKDYKTFVDAEKVKISAALGEDIKTLTLYDNYSFVSLNAYADKVAGIGYVLMVAFLLVTALVVLSTMTRMLDEERAQIACLKTLGYSSSAIILKYLLFALLATGIGGTGAYFVGLGVAYLIYFVFNYSFAMPLMSSGVAIVFYIITFAAIVAATLIATAVAGCRMTGEMPANLLRPKPPKAGKKVIIEKIPFIWNRLSFKYKSTLRNVLRYKSRFIMTVIAVAFSTSLVLAALALLDICLFGGLNSPSVMGIAVVVMIFAGLLTAVVIYTLTNINISERNREIATLMVLGYHDGEVSGYIYREVYINTAIGIVFGYPLSLLLITLIFNIMAQGTLAGISWFMWLLAPVIIFAFTGMVTLILRRKIVKINMNESLKAID